MALGEPAMAKRRHGNGEHHMLLAGKREDTVSSQWTWALEDWWHQDFTWGSQCRLAGPSEPPVGFEPTTFRLLSGCSTS